MRKSLGTSTPLTTKIFLIYPSTFNRFAAGIGQSVPFIYSFPNSLSMVPKYAGRKSAKSLSSDIKKNILVLLYCCIRKEHMHINKNFVTLYF